MKSHIFFQEFSTQIKASIKPKNNYSVDDIIINNRVFHYDSQNNEYVDSELAGFLKKSPEEDYWEFSGDGYNVWFAGTFAEIKRDLKKILAARTTRSSRINFTQVMERVSLS